MSQAIQKEQGIIPVLLTVLQSTLIYSLFQSMGQGQLWPIWVPKIGTACLRAV